MGPRSLTVGSVWLMASSNARPDMSSNAFMRAGVHAFEEPRARAATSRDEGLTPVCLTRSHSARPRKAAEYALHDRDWHVDPSGTASGLRGGTDLSTDTSNAAARASS